MKPQQTFLDRKQALCYDAKRGMIMNEVPSDGKLSKMDDNLEKVEKKENISGTKWSRIWENLIRLGLGETALRAGSGLALVIFALLITWVMGRFYLKQSEATSDGTVSAAVILAPTPTLTVPEYIASPNGAFRENGIIRLAQFHTNMPTKPRFEVVQYTVQKGDSIFGIAEKFNLAPQTILWANYATLGDDPHYLQPDVVLNILPVDGTYYMWNAGDGLSTVADFFGVSPEDILSFDGNHLSKDTIGDYANPNIPAGTWLVIPGGTRDFVSWSAPFITRANPSVAKVVGPGYCGEVLDGPVGNGTFIWPTIEKDISGYNYSPETNHYGIDIGGDIGYAIYAVDNGVVVYAGWNDHGYGNLIIVDHGNGWQSLYAHLNALNVVCGSYVYQGDVIGALGSTGNSSGPHLHFELRSDVYGRANPLNFLPQ